MESSHNHNKAVFTAVACLILGVVLGAVVVNMKAPANSQQGATLKSDFADSALDSEDIRNNWLPVGKSVMLDETQALELKTIFASLQEFSARSFPFVSTGQGGPSYLTYYTCFWFDANGQGHSQVYSTNDNTGGAIYFIPGGACTQN